MDHSSVGTLPVTITQLQTKIWDFLRAYPIARPGSRELSQVLQSLVTVVHWRDTLRIFAAALFLNSFCGILYDANLTQGQVSSSTDEEEGKHRENSKRFTLHCSVWKVPGFLLLTACSFFVMFARITNYVHLVRYGRCLFPFVNGLCHF